jgi:hypothetical protein
MSRFLETGEKDNIASVLMDFANATATLSDSNNAASQDPYQSMELVTGICFLLFLLYISKPNNIPDSRYHRGFILRQQALASRRQRALRMDPNVRQECINDSLIVKTIVAVDENGMTVGDSVVETTESCTHADSVDATNSQRSLNNNDDDDDDDDDEDENNNNSCSICLEPFMVGDVVAWGKPIRPSTTAAAASPTRIVDFGTDSEPKQHPQVCLHVYHKDCIWMWLENPKHDDCPSCRAVILQYPSGNAVDDDTNKQSADESVETDLVDLERGGGIYRIMHGLVQRSNPPRPNYARLVNQTTSSDSAHVNEASIRKRRASLRILSDGVDLGRPIRLRQVMSAGGGPSEFPFTTEPCAAPDMSSTLPLRRVVSSGISSLSRPPEIRRVATTIESSSIWNDFEKDDEDELQIRFV